MNFNEIGLKDLVLDFDSNDLQDITIVQGDTKTRGFKVLVSTNNGEIIKASSQYEMRLYGINSNYPDKSFFTKGTIDGDFYKVYISTDMASKSGKLQLQLALFEGKNALIQSRIKEVDVYASIANGGNVGKDLVVDFGKLQDALAIAEKQQKKFDESLIRQESIESDLNKTKTEVRQFRDGLKDVLTTENARVEAEKKRVSAENTRASQENTRQSNEATRQSNESARQQNESTRQSNETQRQAEESTRKSDEQKRITAETNRNSEESKRDNAEKIRVENENKRISAENKRAENDTQYNKNEEQRQQNEATRQTQEQERVEAEKLRQSQETARKQSEDTRISQEKTRQSQEQSRVDEESKRATSETTREQSEQTRTSKETERQSNEKTRQSNESTRQQQEQSRVEAEKQRAAAESDRAGKFAGWDKTMQGVIPTATSTVAGIVRIDTDGETVAASKKTIDENVNELTKTCNSLDSKIGTAAGLMDIMKNLLESNSNNISNMSIEIENKADKKNVEEVTNELMEAYSDAVNAMNAQRTDLQSKIIDNESEISTNRRKIETLSTIAEYNTNGITSAIATLKQKADKSDLDNKADKKHTHKIADVEGLETALNSKASEEDMDSWTDHIVKFVGEQKEIKDNVAHNFESISLIEAGLNTKAKISDVVNLEEKVDKKVSSDTVKNIFIIEKGASTTSIPANSLIFEKE